MTARTDFDITISERSLGYNLPQKMGRRLWAPMLLMTLMAFPIGLITSWVRSAEIADRAGFDPVVASRLGHLVPAFMFLGFLGVLTAIGFAIARILGAFR